MHADGNSTKFNSSCKGTDDTDANIDKMYFNPRLHPNFYNIKESMNDMHHLDNDILVLIMIFLVFYVIIYDQLFKIISLTVHNGIW